MSSVYLFAVNLAGPQRLPLPGQAESVHDVFDNLPLGVYTTFRTYDHNKFFCLGDHLARLEQSARLLNWNFQPDEAALRRALDRVCTAYPLPEARVRVDILAKPAVELGSDSRLLIALSPFQPVPETYYREGVRVELVRRLRRENPLVKDAHFVLQRRPYLDSGSMAYEYLLLDDTGQLLEGTTSNFYAVRAGALWTAGDGVLEGVTRKIVLQLAGELGIPVCLEGVQVEDIPRLAEASISSSSRAIIPVVAIAGQPVGDGRPGPLTQELMVAYHDFVAKNIRPAV
ncbi:MAG: aminotransferase class IV [Chloroflexi bacterium]|nr:aminotransferase class IV [Chloroflexota bacterium]MCI0580198.1 aminotransferase class IV [Chloroflexota bacterium]MCI0646034.1 aminotransferase class IV [Chloroflexota bacterium]MCI0727376.1 aminotransferase class IV [Chloroflexota bacterium]